MFALTLLFCPAGYASEAGKMFNNADADLNATYQKLLATFQDARHRALFVQAQRSWLKYRDDSVAFYFAHYPASKGGLFLKTALTAERSAFLQLMLDNPPSKDLEGPDPNKF